MIQCPKYYQGGLLTLHSLSFDLLNTVYHCKFKNTLRINVFQSQIATFRLDVYRGSQRENRKP